MYPNNALSAWQLALMAVVAMVTLTGWLIAVFVAAREPGGHNLAVAASPAEAAPADNASRTPATAGREQERSPIDRAAA